MFVSFALSAVRLPWRTCSNKVAVLTSRMSATMAQFMDRKVSPRKTKTCRQETHHSLTITSTGLTHKLLPASEPQMNLLESLCAGGTKASRAFEDKVLK